MLHTLYLSLGSNLGNRRELIEQAIRLIDERVGVVYRVSKMHETEPWGFHSPNKFLNACCQVNTMLNPRRCLQETQQIERELGREDKSKNGIYHDRPIDIDLLMYDNLNINEDGLVLPHPRMHERAFVMIPLQEIFDQ